MNIEGKVKIEGHQFDKLFRLLNACTEDSANARTARMYVDDLLTQAFNKGRQVERAANNPYCTTAVEVDHSNTPAPHSTRKK